MPLFKRKKELEQLKNELNSTKSDINELKENIDEIKDNLEQIIQNLGSSNEKKSQNEPIEDDLTDLNVYIRKISQAKTPQELEALRLKRKILMQSRASEIARMKYQSQKRKKELEGDEGNMENINKIWEIYDNLNPILKNLIKSYVKSKAGIDIEELKEHPEQLMSLINAYIQSQSQNQEQKENKKPVTPEELKKKADELEEKILKGEI
jgi:DNA repair exonuclease SbcCD ATPase subunit